MRFSLEQQPIVKPFVESVQERFSEWLMDRSPARITFTPEELAWLNLIRSHSSRDCVGCLTFFAENARVGLCL